MSCFFYDLDIKIFSLFKPGTPVLLCVNHQFIYMTVSVYERGKKLFGKSGRKP